MVTDICVELSQHSGLGPLPLKIVVGEKRKSSRHIRELELERSPFHPGLSDFRLALKRLANFRRYSGQQMVSRPVPVKLRADEQGEEQCDKDE